MSAPTPEKCPLLLRRECLPPTPHLGQEPLSTSAPRSSHRSQGRLAEGRRWVWAEGESTPFRGSAGTDALGGAKALPGSVASRSVLALQQAALLLVLWLTAPASPLGPLTSLRPPSVEDSSSPSSPGRGRTEYGHARATTPGASGHPHLRVAPAIAGPSDGPCVSLQAPLRAPRTRDVVRAFPRGTGRVTA